MLEVLKFITVTILSKPLEIHSIQVHSFRKPVVFQSVGSSGSWSFFQGRGSKYFKQKKTTVEFPAQICKMEQGNNPIDSKEMDKVEINSSFTRIFFLVCVWGGVGGGPAEQK